MLTKHPECDATDSATPGPTTPRLSQPAERRPLTSFFVLAYALSWVLWIPLCLLREGTPEFYVSLAILLGSNVPSAVGIFLTATTLGKGGLRTLLKRLLIWRVGLRWYIVLLAPTLLVLAAITAAVVVVGGPTATLGLPLVNAILTVAFMIFPGSALGEEIGWRGYALPRLQVRRSALTASLILGTLHGLWHAPLWLRGLPDHPLHLFPAFAVQAVALGVIYTWLYNSTRGSMLLAVLFHAATNAPLTLILLPMGVADFTLPFWLMAVVTVIAASIVVVAAGPSELSRRHLRQQTPAIAAASSATDATRRTVPRTRTRTRTRT